jgi:hypothetical protein
MEPSRDAFEKEDPSTKSAQELMDLLLKLNAKLKEKIRPTKRKEAESEQTEMVIILMTNRDARPRSGRPGKTENPESRAADWMEEMFAQIEEIPARRRKRP